MSFSFCVFQTFHTPSFGDEEFNIQPISLSVSDPVSQAHNTLYSSQLLSHHLPDGNINGTQPLSHHPGTTVAGGYSQSQTLPQHGGIPQPHNQQSQHNHNVNFLTPKFPPQNIDIPDISASNYNNIPNSQPQQIYAFSPASTNNGYQQHQGGFQHPQNSIVRSLSATTALTREPTLSTVSQQQLGSDLGRQVAANQSGKATMDGRQVSPPGSTNTSPGRESSEDSDDSLPLAQVRHIQVRNISNLSMSLNVCENVATTLFSFFPSFCLNPTCFSFKANFSCAKHDMCFFAPSSRQGDLPSSFVIHLNVFKGVGAYLISMPPYLYVR